MQGNHTTPWWYHHRVSCTCIQSSNMLPRCLWACLGHPVCSYHTPRSIQRTTRKKLRTCSAQSTPRGDRLPTSDTSDTRMSHFYQQCSIHTRFHSKNDTTLKGVWRHVIASTRCVQNALLIIVIGEHRYCGRSAHSQPKCGTTHASHLAAPGCFAHQNYHKKSTHTHTISGRCLTLDCIHMTLHSQLPTHAHRHRDTANIIVLHAHLSGTKCTCIYNLMHYDLMPQNSATLFF